MTTAGAADPSRRSELDVVLQRLSTLHPKVIDLSLGRIEGLLNTLGNPQRQLGPVVHVAGTNGKGSTIAFLRAMLEAAGYRVHVYTSPHLVRFNERIRVAGQLISDEALLALVDECEAANAGQPITFFEITTAVAFLAFARTPADIVLLETGLGGRLDATNVVERPAVTAITRISIDHTQFLGDSLVSIAAEKAGIMKRGVACVIADQPSGPEVMDTLRARGADVGAALLEYGRDWSVKATSRGFGFQDVVRTIELPRPALIGPHQLINAGTALACLSRLSEFRVSDAALTTAMSTVEWPGRLQRLTRGPLVEMLPVGWELWLDGGHNDSGGEALAMQAAEWRDMPLALIVGMLTTKEPGDFLGPLRPFVSSLRSVTIDGEHASRSAEDTAEAARIAGISESQPAESVAAAVASLPSTGNSFRVLICGSLYLAGTILAENA